MGLLTSAAVVIDEFLKNQRKKKMHDPDEYIPENEETSENDSSKVLPKVRNFPKKLKTEALGLVHLICFPEKILRKLGKKIMFKLISFLAFTSF